MKKISVILFTFFLIFFALKEIKANPPLPPKNPASIQGYFYSSLTPYGTWIYIDFGVYAWRPTIITRTWAPYKMGRWIWTDYGWYWDSYEPFGFIVYHYGRWHYDDYYGWIWIPDYEWAPAWVEWRYDDYYIGWAPLPPYAVFRPYVGIVYTYTYVIPVVHWHFVKIKYFCDPYVYNYYIPEKTKYRVHSNTKYRNEYRYSNGRIRNEGVEFDFVRQRVGDNIRKRDLVITDDPRNFENSRKRERDRITTFIADRDRILKDRESIRSADVVRDNRRPSIDLSRVELAEVRNRDESRSGDEIRNRDDERINVRENSKNIRQERSNESREANRIELEKRNNERRNFERQEFERRESERREIERRESERRNNEILEQRRNENLEQRKNESRENEIIRERQRNQANNEQNRQYQLEQERRNSSWNSQNIEQQRSPRNNDERRIERNESSTRDNNRDVRVQQRNEPPRTDNYRQSSREQRQDTETRQRVR